VHGTAYRSTPRLFMGLIELGSYFLLPFSIACYRKGHILAIGDEWFLCFQIVWSVVWGVIDDEICVYHRRGGLVSR
jgi:hypothetical protein